MHPTKTIMDYINEMDRLFLRDSDNDSSHSPLTPRTSFSNSLAQSSSSTDTSPDTFPDILLGYSDSHAARHYGHTNTQQKKQRDYDRDFDRYLNSDYEYRHPDKFNMGYTQETPFNLTKRQRPIFGRKILVDNIQMPKDPIRFDHFSENYNEQNKYGLYELFPNKSPVKPTSNLLTPSEMHGLRYLQNYPQNSMSSRIDMPPRSTNLSQKTNLSPTFSDMSSTMTNMSRTMTNLSPKSPTMTNMSPNSNMTAAMTNMSPRMAKMSPTMVNLSPTSSYMSLGTNMSQTMTNMSPTMRNMSPTLSSMASMSPPSPMNYMSLPYANFPAFKEPLASPKHLQGSKMCTFCRKNGETALVYTTHTVKEKIKGKNVVTCPILRAHVCSTCGASGDNAHTITYCPVLRQHSAAPLQSTTVRLKNTRVKSNGRRRY